MASNESLKLHWKRSCWVIHMWGQADLNEMQLEPLSEYRWAFKNGSLTMEWDTTQNIERIHNRLQALTKGCKCATGCSTKRCSCRKRGNTCSAGCECTNCCNTSEGSVNPDVPETDSAIRELSIEEDMDSRTYAEADDVSDFIFNEEVDDIIDFVFNNDAFSGTDTDDEF